MPQLSEPARSRLRATTSATPDEVRDAAARAAASAKGDLYNGRQRMSRLRSAAGSDVYEVRDVLGTRRLMVVRVVAARKEGRTAVRVDVEEAAIVARSRLIRMKEPRVLALHTLRQFLASLADALRELDPAVSVRVRETLTD